MAHMSICEDDSIRVSVGAKGFKTLRRIPMTTSLQEVLALMFQTPGLQAYRQNVFKVQTPFDGQRRLEECGDYPAVFVIISSDTALQGIPSQVKKHPRIFSIFPAFKV